MNDSSSYRNLESLLTGEPLPVLYEANTFPVPTQDMMKMYSDLNALVALPAFAGFCLFMRQESHRRTIMHKAATATESELRFAAAYREVVMEIPRAVVSYIAEIDSAIQAHKKALAEQEEGGNPNEPVTSQ